MLSAAISWLLLSISLLVTPIMGQTSLTASPASSFDFEELTIPFLRQHSYDSQLISLKKQSETESYIAYRGSYLSGGNLINTLITIPKGREPQKGWPAVIFIHGYIRPELYQTERNYNSFTNYPSQNGLVVMKIDLRGHGRSEGDPAGSYFSSAPRSFV